MMVGSGIFFEDAVGEFEKLFIIRVLERHRGNISKAAEELKIHRNTLSKKLEKYRAEEGGTLIKLRKVPRLLRRRAGVK